MEEKKIDLIGFHVIQLSITQKNVSVQLGDPRNVIAKNWYTCGS